MVFQFDKKFSPRKEIFDGELFHSRDCNSLGLVTIVPGHFPVVFSLSQISSDQITPGKLSVSHQWLFWAHLYT